MRHPSNRAGTFLCAAWATWAALFAKVSVADVSLPALMRDGCVLQRETDAAIYGFAAPGEVVNVKPSWQGDGSGPNSATADAKGLWSVSVSTRGVGAGPHTIDVRGMNTVTIRDVLVGEVWVCSGQSNMEWPLAASEGGDAAAKDADPLVRLFTVENTISLHERLDVNGAWMPASERSSPNFSAVGYHFAKRFRESMNVPVGVISADWGGTRVEAWMSDKALETIGPLKDELALLTKARDPFTRPTGGESLERKWWGMFDAAGGIPAAWRTENFDDSAWKKTTLPAHFAGDLASFDGVVCYRRAVNIPAELLSKGDAKVTLSLGPIDDRDEAFVNGRLVGATYEDNKWSEDRVYTVPASLLHAGENTIAIAVLDTAGLGGVFGEPGQMSLTIGEAKPIPLTGEWKYRPGVKAANLPAQPKAFEVNPNSLGVLYRGMIAPIAHHTISGVIWYQGESNVGHAAEYAERFPAMITDWRRAFSRDQMGFYYVQIAPYRYTRDTGEAALLREAQTKALSLPRTGMVVTMDVGNPADIHPRDKRTVGRRLAELALADLGAITDPAMTNYPTLLRTRDIGGGVMAADFNIAPGELVTRGDSLLGFELAGEDKKFFPAQAAIRGSTVEAWTPSVPTPLAMRYGFCTECEPTLGSRAGLPAVPFRTDAWMLGEWSHDQETDLEALRGNEPGFRGLFDGTLKGWTNVNTFPSTWTVGMDERGRPVIHCTGTPTGVLRTNEQFENFVLELEWRHLQPRSNAGLFVWSDPLTARGQPFTRSVEVQVMDGMEDTWYTSDGDVFPIHGAKMTPLTRPSGNRAMPLEKRMNPSPMWNHYRVECINGELSLAVNGKVVTRGKDISPRKGYICLESEGGPIDFRNIRVKVLPGASGGLDPALHAAADEGFSPLLTDESLPLWDLTDAQKGHWVMDDWVLRYDGKATHLKTRKEYRNYELIADWRFPGKAKDDNVPVILPDGTSKTEAGGKIVTEPIKNYGDSGIYLRGTERSQVNIWCWPVGSGELWDVRNDKNASKEVRAGATPKSRADVQAGQWNRFRIRLVGDHVTVDLNGTRVIDNAQIPGINERGPILLQHHGDPMEWANIYVRELDEEGK